MSGESRLRQIYEFRTIDGVNNNPSSSEHNKFHVWNNNTQVFDYTSIGEEHIDIDFFVTFIKEVIGDTDTNTYLSSISKIDSYGQFTLTNGTNLYLELGELAWLDEIPPSKYDLGLPGNKKVLFDDNDSLGGEDAFKYDKSVNKVQFQGTSLVFDLTSGTEGIYKEGVKYLGNYSWSFGQGDNSLNSGSYNLFAGYKAGAGFESTSTKNLILGAYAGQLAGNDLEGSIFVGPYAGRYETASNKFFLDNTDYSNTSTARDNSFLYADLDVERRLYIRDRLSVEKEGKFGTSGLVDAEGEYGMYQMSAETGGNPQWHDGTAWQDFANSTNTYLNDVTYSGGELTFTLSDASTIGPVDISALNTNVFATSLGSPETGQTSTSNYGYLQISNSSFTYNNGFTFKTGLLWNNSTQELAIPGSIFLPNRSEYTALNGAIMYNGNHFLGRIGGNWLQLDNVPSTGEPNTASNVGTGIEFWADKDDYDLRFFTLNSADPRITLTQATDPDTDAENIIDLELTLQGSNLPTSSGLTYSGEIFDIGSDLTGIAPQFDFNTLVSDTISINSTSVPGELRLEYSHTDNTGTNLGDDTFGLYTTNAGDVLQFKSLIEGDNIDLTASTTEIEVAVIPGTLTNLTGTVTGIDTSDDLYLLSQGTGLDFDQKFIRAKSGGNISVTKIEDASSNTVGYEIDATSGVAGEVNTMTNLGTGEGFYYQKSGVQFEMKSLKAEAGSNISLSSDNNEITISSSNIDADFSGYTGGGTEDIDYFYPAIADNTSHNIIVKPIVSGTGATVSLNGDGAIEISATGTGGGETNTQSNTGSQAEVSKPKSGVNFPFRTIGTLSPSLSSGYSYDNIEVIENTDEILIAAKDETPLTLNTTGQYYILENTGHAISQKKLDTNSSNVTITDNDDGSIYIDFVGGGGEVNTGTNLGADGNNDYINIYDRTDAPVLKFKTLTSTGNHITIDDNIDGQHIDFSIDDITLSLLGTGIYPLVQNNTDSFTFTQKAFTEGYAISLDNSTDADLIEIGVNENIPYTDFSTQYRTYSDGLLTFKVLHTDDIVNTATSATSIAELNIGDGLLYDSSTNTLYTNNSTTTGADNYLVSITDDFTNSNFTDLADIQTGSYLKKTYSIEDGLGNVLHTIDTSIPEYTLPVAGDETGDIGGIKIEDVKQPWKKTTTTGEYTHPLIYDEITGILKGNKLLVSYEEQGFLHDEDNLGGVTGEPTFNEYRSQARANIGAAYINGNAAENFDVFDLDVARILTADNLTSTHTIGNYEITGTTIQGNSNISNWYGNNLSNTRIRQTQSTIDLFLDGTTKTVNIYDQDTGDKMFKFDASTGDLYIRGSIRTGGTVEVFDDGALNM